MFETIYKIYDSIIFFITLFTLVGLFCKDEEKYPYFWLRLFGVTLFTCVVSYFVVYFTADIAKYFIGIAMTIIGIRLCFKMHVTKISFFTVCSYALFSLANSIFFLLYSGLYYLGVKFGNSSWPMELTRLGVTVPILALVLVLYFHFVVKKERVEFYDKSVILPFVVVLFIVFAVQNLPIGNFTEAEDQIKLILFMATDGLAVNFVILFAMYKLFQTNNLQVENGILNQLALKQKEQYESQKKNIDYINIKCHDLRKQIDYLKGNVSDQALDEMRSKINIYDCYARTGNDILDTVISEKSLLCEREKISFTYMIDGKPLSYLDTLDVCAIYVNMLDNAVEAVLKIDKVENRMISLKTVAVGNMLYITCFNSVQEVKQDANGALVTTKEDNKNHGFGLKSIQSTVMKLDGEMKYYVKDNIFNLNILLPIPQQKLEENTAE